MGQEPENRVGNLFRLTAALHGNHCLYPLYTLRLAAFCVQPGIDEARAQSAFTRIPSSATFPGEAYSERLNGSFAGCVVNGLAGRSILRGPRRNIDDPSTEPTVSSRHPADRLAGTDHRAQDVDSEDFLKPRDFHGIKAHLRCKGRRVVDQGGDVAQR